MHGRGVMRSFEPDLEHLTLLSYFAGTQWCQIDKGQPLTCPSCEVDSTLFFEPGVQISRSESAAYLEMRERGEQPGQGIVVLPGIVGSWCCMLSNG